jgi:phosphonate transport system substrate-binding protein
MSKGMMQLGAALVLGLVIGLLGAKLIWPGEAEKPSAQQAVGSAEDWRSRIKELRIGITGSERDSQRMSELDQYTADISKRIGVPVSFVQASDYSGVIQAIAAKQIEMAITGADAYAAMYEATNGNVEPLVTNLEADGSLGYYSAMIVRADSPYQKLEDLKGKIIGYPDPNSTSGYLFPRHAMRKLGIDPEKYFAKNLFAGGHPQAAIGVVRSQYDAAFTWVSGVGDPAQGFTRGNLRIMVDAGQLDMKDLRVIKLFGPIPNGPTVIRKDLPQELKDLVRGVLCAMSFEDPKTFKSVTGGEGGGYVAVPHSFYQGIIELRDEERALRRND